MPTKVAGATDNEVGIAGGLHRRRVGRNPFRRGDAAMRAEPPELSTWQCPNGRVR